MKEKWTITDDSKHYVRRIIRPIKGFKTNWIGEEVSEREANEIKKTFTYVHGGQIIPVYFEIEHITIHTNKTIIESIGKIL